MIKAEENNEEPRTLEEKEEVQQDAEAGGLNPNPSEPAAELSKEPISSESDEAAASASASTEEPRGRRERKSIQSFNPEEYDAQKKEIEIPVGSGVKLMDIPNVVENFKDVTWSDPHLKMLHFLIFGGRGKKKEFKTHLLQFNGVVYPEGKDVEVERTKMREKMYKLTLPELTSVMDLVDVPRSGTSFGLEKNKVPSKEDYCTRLLEWLEEPVVSGIKRNEPSSKKRKSTTRSSTSGSAKKSSSSTEKKKKSPSTQKKKAATSSSNKPKTAAATSVIDEREVNINIPGVDIDKLREKVRNIVKTGNRDTLSVKSIRAMLEDWLDTDLGNHRDAIRTIVMDEL